MGPLWVPIRGPHPVPGGRGRRPPWAEHRGRTGGTGLVEQPLQAAAPPPALQAPADAPGRGVGWGFRPSTETAASNTENRRFWSPVIRSLSDPAFKDPASRPPALGAGPRVPDAPGCSGRGQLPAGDRRHPLTHPQLPQQLNGPPTECAKSMSKVRPTAPPEQ